MGKCVWPEISHLEQSSMPINRSLLYSLMLNSVIANNFSFMSESASADRNFEGSVV